MPNVEMVALWAVAGTLTALGVAERWVNQRRLQRIALRIHVNGSRGKSSTTRLIAAGLRADGRRVVAKTTGTSPRLIDAHGCDHELPRRRSPAVVEQRRVVAWAAQARAQVLVVECMALQPALQRISQTAWLQAHWAVITNVRPDHLDVMGPRLTDVARAFAGTLPHRGRCFVGEATLLPHLAAEAKRRDCTLQCVTPAERTAAAAALPHFAHAEHADNVALALALCGAMGVARQAALAAMLQSTPDPGARQDLHFRQAGRCVTFVAGFAANDVDSSCALWQGALAQGWAVQTRIAIVNCRRDRSHRSRALGQALARWTGLDGVYAVGAGAPLFVRAFTRAATGASSAALQCDAGARAEVADAWLDALLARHPGPLLLVGLGNTADMGLALTAAARRLHDADTQRGGA